MTLDPYAPCPGGTNKKIKFCCPDLVGDLEKIDRMLAAEQRAACLETVDAALKKCPDRACLLAHKIALDSELRGEELARATADHYLQVYPDNPVALSELSMLQAGKEGGPTAARTLQKAIEVSAGQFPGQVYDALGLIAAALLNGGHIIAGRHFLMLQVRLSNAEDSNPLGVLGRIDAATAIPLLLKQDLNLHDCPADALWKESFNKALEFAHRAAWLKAAECLAELAQQAGRWPDIMYNLGLLRTWYGDDAGAVEPLRSFAAFPEVPLDDAVEAEVLAQLLDQAGIDMVDSVRLRFAVRDVEALQGRLFASPQTPRMPIDLTQLGTEEQPPPKGAYYLLDRPQPKTGVGIAIGDVPRVVGQAFLFGKQTDRDAMLEVMTHRGPALEGTRQALITAAGDALGDVVSEEAVEQVPAIQLAMQSYWRLPDDVPPTERAALMTAERKFLLVERWANLPQKIFGGKSALAVAGDPQYRIALRAAVLNLELSDTSTGREADLDELRGKLGLPSPEPVDPRAFPHAQVPLPRLARVDVSLLDDEGLATNFERAQHFRHLAALRLLATEIARRPDFKEPELKATAYGALAQSEPDVERAVGYLDEARKCAEAAGQSTAPWDIVELTLRLSMQDAPAVQRLMHHLQTEHIREPGVAQSLLRVLSEFGLIGPDGRPTMPEQPAAAGIGPDDAGRPTGRCSGSRREQTLDPWVRTGRRAPRSLPSGPRVVEPPAHDGRRTR